MANLREFTCAARLRHRLLQSRCNIINIINIVKHSKHNESANIIVNIIANIIVNIANISANPCVHISQRAEAPAGACRAPAHTLPPGLSAIPGPL